MNRNVYTNFDGDCIARWGEAAVCGFTAPHPAFTIAYGIDYHQG